MTIEEIFAENEHVSSVRSKLMTAKKIQLHTGLEGYNDPERFGVYKNGGNGECLGICSNSYEPMNLQLFYDNIVSSLTEFENKFDLSTIEYKEHKDGKKVQITVQSKDFTVKSSPIIGDKYKSRISFNTGFDVLTKSTLSFQVFRLVCSNGNKSWKNELNLGYKNTFGNVGKILNLTTQISQIDAEIDNYQADLEKVANKKYTKEEIDNIYFKLLGYSYKEYKDLTTRKRNILDAINNSVLIETSTLGNTGFGLINGITRYSTHTVNKGNIDGVLYDSSADMNQKIHELILN